MRTELPLVSVVTPAYNEENYIQETLDSVRLQDYSRVEHIVIDDGSDDHTRDILAKNEHKYNLRWKSKTNEGQASAVNEGFKMANGEVVIWLNGDDILFDKNTISTIVRIFEREPSVSILYGNRADLDKHTRLKNILVPVPWFSHKRLRRWYFASFVFMRKEVVEKHKLDPDYEYVLDYEYYVRVSGDGFSFKYVPKTLYGFRKHKKAKSSAGSTQMNAEAQKLKKEIGLNSGLNHSVQKIVDKLLYIVLQVWGVILYIYHKKLGQNFCK